jgi:hypothetical protein
MGDVKSFAAKSIASFGKKKEISLLLCRISLGIFNDLV